MPKHYKEMIDEIINKMDEAKAIGGKFIVRMKRPGQNTVSAIFDTKAQADAYEKEKKKLGFQIEDAPANSVAGGGVDLAPNAAVSQSPHMVKRKKEQGAEQEKIKNKIKKMVQNNEDNNNIVFKQVLDGLDKVDTKIDELSYGKTEIKEVEKKEYKTFKDKYNG
tara:strand:- start:66 stop:557 length:492 start_codon:yes stop_codon:yes gene_type:complete